MRQRWRRVAPLSVFVLMCLYSQTAIAGGYDKFDFSLRFPAALSRFSTYADAAGVGGASAASKWPSSTNPAGMAWEPMSAGMRFTAGPQFSTVDFDAETRLDVFTESLSVEGGDAGRFLVSGAQARSNKSIDRSGLGYGFDLNLVQLAWGKRFTPEWAAGLAFTYDRSRTNFDLSSLDVARSSDETYSVKLGLHYRASKKLHLALVFEQAVAPSKTDYFDVLGTGVGTVRDEDTTWQTSLRPGLAYEYAPQSTIFADYQFARFSNATGTLIVNRVFAGIEQRVFQGIFLRGGANVDTRGNIGWTAGIGFYPTPTISLGFAFQDNNFPELESDFGRSRTFILSGSICF